MLEPAEVARMCGDLSVRRRQNERMIALMREIAALPSGAICPDAIISRAHEEIEMQDYLSERGVGKSHESEGSHVG